jgi:hypothetical protein
MKPPKTPQLVIIGILTLITIFFWIAFEVYRGFSVKPPPAVPAEVISPINPALDADTLNKLQQRVHLSDEEIGNNAVAAQPTSAPSAPVTPAPTSTPPLATPISTSTPSASPLPSP